MGTHIIRSEAAPTEAPTEEMIGVHWVKETAPFGHWLAINTTAGGWLDLLNLPSGGGGSAAPIIKSFGAYIPVLHDEKEVYNTPVAPKYAQSMSTAVNYNIGGNWIEYFPIVVGRTMALSAVTASATAPATGNLKMALYDSDPISGLPKNRVWQGTKALSSHSVLGIDVAPNVVLEPGVYWVCLRTVEADIKVTAYKTEFAYHFGWYNVIGSSSAGGDYPLVANEADLIPNKYYSVVVPVVTLVGA